MTRYFYRLAQLIPLFPDPGGSKLDLPVPQILETLFD